MTVMVAISGCAACHRVFMYDPLTVPSVLIDPHTGLPPDNGPDGGKRQPDPAALARATREPLCPACCRAANRVRAQRGLPLLPEGDSLADVATLEDQP